MTKLQNKLAFGLYYFTMVSHSNRTGRRTCILSVSKLFHLHQRASNPCPDECRTDSHLDKSSYWLISSDQQALPAIDVFHLSIATKIATLGGTRSPRYLSPRNHVPGTLGGANGRASLRICYVLDREHAPFPYCASSEHSSSDISI